MRTRRILAEMQHLGAAIDLLVAVGHRDRVELAARIVAAQDAGRVLPGDGRAGLDLGPGDLRAVAATVASLGDEIVDAALALGIARIPILHRRILDLRIVERNQLDHRRMQLVLVALRRRAAFEIGDVGAFLRDDQRALELARIPLVDAEIGRQLHRAAHPLGHEDERTVGEHRRIERGVEIVGHRDHGAEILPHQLGMLADGLRNRAEDDAGPGELLLEGGDHRYRVEHRVDRHPAGLVDVVVGGIDQPRLVGILLARRFHASQDLLLLQRDAQLLVDLEQFGVDLAQRARPGLVLRRRIIVDVLEIDPRIVDARPGRLFQRQPAAESREPPFEHPAGFVLLLRDEADDVLGQAFRRLVRLDLRLEAVFVLVHIDPADLVDGLLHGRHQRSPSTPGSRPGSFRTMAPRCGVSFI